MQIQVEPATRWRGQRRFWDPIEGRYYRYRRPELMRGVCIRCKSAFTFFAKEVPSHRFDETSGGWEVLRGAISGAIEGRGGCGRCGHIVNVLQWPDDAYFKVKVPEGLVWAWNETYLPILLARVAGDKVAVRQLAMKDAGLRSVGTERNGAASYALSNGQVDEYPLSWCVDLQSCFDAFRSFHRHHGVRPECITWTDS